MAIGHFADAKAQGAVGGSVGVTQLLSTLDIDHLPSSEQYNEGTTHRVLFSQSKSLDNIFFLNTPLQSPSRKLLPNLRFSLSVKKTEEHCRHVYLEYGLLECRK